MLIQVLYPDNRYDYVKDHMLHELIENRQIVEFKRSSGWVTIGIDPVRKSNRDYQRKPEFNFSNKPEFEVKNCIRVEYNDKRHDYVTDDMLVNLIESNRIVKYMRSNNWVFVGTDPENEAMMIEHNFRELSEAAH